MSWIRAELEGGCTSLKTNLTRLPGGGFTRQSIFPAVWGSGELSEKARQGCPHRHLLWSIFSVQAKQPFCTGLRIQK